LIKEKFSSGIKLVVAKNENSIVHPIFVLNTYVGKTLSKYSLHSLGFHLSQIQSLMWKHFVDMSVF